MGGATSRDEGEVPYNIGLAMRIAVMKRNLLQDQLTRRNYHSAYEAMTRLLPPGSSVVEYALGSQDWNYTRTRQLTGIIEQDGGLQLQFEDDDSDLAQRVDLTLDGSTEYLVRFGVVYVGTPMDQITLTGGKAMDDQTGHPYNGIPDQTHVLLMYAPVKPTDH